MMHVSANLHASKMMMSDDPICTHVINEHVRR